MASVSVQVKNGTWYGIISYKDAGGKWRQKWRSTGLPEKGNKKRAQKAADAFLAEFKEPSRLDCEDLLLTDYLQYHWLPFAKNNVAATTYPGYEAAVTQSIIPYFEPMQVKLRELDAKTVQKFYYDMQHHGGRRGQSLKSATVRRYHAVLHRALYHAVKLELISFNPADNMDLPKKEQMIHNTFSEQELCDLIELTRDEDIGLLLKLEAFYGLRRSEGLGIRWRAIDFENDLLTINHTVSAIRENGRSVLVKKDRTKNASSYRTLPLNEDLKRDLLSLNKKHAENKELFGNGYNTDDEDYVFVDVLGNLFHPDYVSRKFSRLLKKHGLKKIRFHDLRHSVASLLVKHDMPMKYIQTWMGHSDFATTANIYSHVDSDVSKDRMAGVMTDILRMGTERTEETTNAEQERTTGENSAKMKEEVTPV